MEPRPMQTYVVQLHNLNNDMQPVDGRPQTFIVRAYTPRHANIVAMDKAKLAYGPDVLVQHLDEGTAFRFITGKAGAMRCHAEALPDDDLRIPYAVEIP